MSILERIKKLFRSEPERRAVAITYSLGESEQGRFIQCTVCKSTSYNPNDIEQLYCGFCAQYHPVVTRKFGG